MFCALFPKHQLCETETVTGNKRRAQRSGTGCDRTDETERVAVGGGGRISERNMTIPFSPCACTACSSTTPAWAGADSRLRPRTGLYCSVTHRLNSLKKVAMTGKCSFASSGQANARTHAYKPRFRLTFQACRQLLKMSARRSARGEAALCAVYRPPERASYS